MMAQPQRRSGKLGSLTDYRGGSKPKENEPVRDRVEIADVPEPVIEDQPKTVIEEQSKSVAKTPKHKPQPNKEERLVTVNIKIKEAQQEWLTDTAKQVRQNNDAPVPASDRVYPQHLIQTAIDLLQSATVDWQQVKNVEDLRKILSL